MSPNQDVMMWSGFLGSIMSFIASMIAATLVYLSNRKQQTLQQLLQQDNLKFQTQMRTEAEASAKRLEEHRHELSRMHALESVHIRELAEAVSKSRSCTGAAMQRFRTLLKKSRSAENKDFLIEFQQSILALTNYSEALSNLQYLVPPKDLEIFNKVQRNFLQILLGMRLEKERRELNDFISRVTEYENYLDKVETQIRDKYQSVLQPKASQESCLQQLTR